MTEARIPVDLLNPGQVFACLGFMEAAEIILKTRCEASFDYVGIETDTTFSLCADSDRDPIASVIEFLAQASAYAVVPTGSSLSTKQWNVTMVSSLDLIFPSAEPLMPAKLPVELDADGIGLPIEHWAEGAASGRDNVKFWAGSGGYPGAALARDVIALVGELSPADRSLAIREPFSIAKPMSSKFRFDWRRDYVPLDAGFSLNNLKHISTIGYPIVEVMAAIGLQNARPIRIDKLNYKYGVWSGRLPSILARAVLGTAPIGFPMRTFHMYLGWPGKEGQARCIINAQEEFEHDRR